MFCPCSEALVLASDGDRMLDHTMHRADPVSNCSVLMERNVAFQAVEDQVETSCSDRVLSGLAIIWGYGIISAQALYMC